jgi:hypothetical protein
MNYSTQLQNLIDTLTNSLEDANKFDGGVDAAGKRLRATCQDVKAQLQNLRISIQTERNSRKVQS